MNSAAQSPDPELGYFEIQSLIGTTKHMGGLEMTRILIERCALTDRARVLDVGCGVGATAVHLAENGTRRVIALDRLHSMTVQARERARREGVGDRVGFVTADARHLPFAEGRFDGILCESVLTFIDDKQHPIDELGRVAEPAACVGLNEETWLEPPTRAMKDYAARTWSIEAEIPAAEEWAAMMRSSGFEVRWMESYVIDPGREATQVKRYRLRDMVGMLVKTIRLALTRPDFREYLKKERHMPKGYFRHLGYVLLMGERSKRAAVAP